MRQVASSVVVIDIAVVQVEHVVVDVRNILIFFHHRYICNK